MLFGLLRPAIRISTMVPFLPPAVDESMAKGESDPAGPSPLFFSSFGRYHAVTPRG